jgi:hypothetical protein
MRVRSIKESNVWLRLLSMYYLIYNPHDFRGVTRELQAFEKKLAIKTAGCARRIKAHAILGASPQTLRVCYSNLKFIHSIH